MKTTLMLMLFIVFGCVAPHAPAASTPPDEKAFKLLQEAVKTYANMQTISGDFVVRQHVVGHPANEMSGTFKAQKPNRYRIDAGGAIPLRFVSDGKNVLMVFNQQNAYSEVLRSVDDQPSGGDYHYPDQCCFYGFPSGTFSGWRAACNH